uniref:Uncharacterized protein n=1 Tax=Agrobacterium vitis TaxID=373 RepID=A0A2Z2Q474_AGRVI|nr:hypothetical protein [Agrobacterium vitis]
MLLRKKIACGVDPRHRDLQAELLDSQIREKCFQATPTLAIPDHRRVFIPKTQQLAIQVNNQCR